MACVDNHVSQKPPTGWYPRATDVPIRHLKGGALAMQGWAEHKELNAARRRRSSQARVEKCKGSAEEDEIPGSEGKDLGKRWRLKRGLTVPTKPCDLSQVPAPEPPMRVFGTLRKDRNIKNGQRPDPQWRCVGIEAGTVVTYPVLINQNSGYLAGLPEEARPSINHLGGSRTNPKSGRDKGGLVRAKRARST